MRDNYFHIIYLTFFYKTFLLHAKITCWFFESILQLLNLHKIKKEKQKTQQTNTTEQEPKDLRDSATATHIQCGHLV